MQRRPTKSSEERRPRSTERSQMRLTLPRPSWQTEDTDLRFRKFARQTRAHCFGIALAQRIDQQAAIDLLVAAAQFFLHREGHSGRVKRNPDFAAANGRILNDGFEKSAEPSARALGFDCNGSKSYYRPRLS